MAITKAAGPAFLAIALAARVASAGPWLDEPRACPHDGKTIPVARGAVMTASKRAGAWQGGAGLMLWSPGYEINDLGTLQATDWIYATANARYFDVEPGHRLQTWNAGAGSNTSWNFGGLHRPTDIYASVAATTLAFNYFSLNGAVQTAGGSDDLTRGGPAMQVGWAGQLAATASTPTGRARLLSGDRIELTTTHNRW